MYSIADQSKALSTHSTYARVVWSMHRGFVQRWVQSGHMPWYLLIDLQRIVGFRG
jgi:hypothetical protein